MKLICPLKFHCESPSQTCVRIGHDHKAWSTSWAVLTLHIILPLHAYSSILIYIFVSKKKKKKDFSLDIYK